MQPFESKKTWVVVLRGRNAAVYERASRDGTLTPLQDFAAQTPDDPMLRELASWLDVARRARSFERLMLVAPENDADHLVSNLSRPTRALLAATQPEVLRKLPAEIRP